MTSWTEAHASTVERDDEPHDPRDAEIARLREEVAELKSDIAHAQKYAKEYEPDYPWQLGTASEVMWCLGESLHGVEKAVRDWQRTANLMIAAGLVTIEQLCEYGLKARKQTDDEGKR